MSTYTTIILTGIAAITLLAAGLALNVYLKHRFGENSLEYGLAHVGIIWAVLIGSLLIGGTLTSAVAHWLSENSFLTAMIISSAYAISIAESYRQLSARYAVVSSLLYVGVTECAVPNGLTTLFCIIAASVTLIVVCFVIGFKISDLKEAARLEKEVLSYYDKDGASDKPNFVRASIEHNGVPTQPVPVKPVFNRRRVWERQTLVEETTTD